MIKSFFYSIFLHSLLAILLYANFKIYQPKSTKSKELKVGLMIVDNRVAIINPATNAPQQNDPVTIIPKKQDKKEPKQLTKPEIEPMTNQPAQMPKQSSQQQIAKDDVKTNSSKNQNTKQKALDHKQNIPKIIKEPEYKPLESKKYIAPINNNSLEKTPLNINQNDNIKKNEDINEISFQANGLSNREKINIKSQIKLCFQKAIEESGKTSEIKISIKAEIKNDGTIDYFYDKLIATTQSQNSKNNKYKIALDNAIRALDICSPLRNIPQDKLETLKEVIFEFEN
jgi:hypothetical protein